MSNMRYVLAFAVFSCCIFRSNFLPTSGERKSSSDVLDFMKKFGYVVDEGGEAEALYTEEGLKSSIMTMQKFGGIEQTGIIDNATLKLITSPRCGVPDIIANNRKKRFALIGGWNKRNITYFISNYSPKLGEEVVANNIQKALDLWGSYGRLTFTRVYNQYADIIVAFATGDHGDGNPFDGPGLILAHAFFPQNSESTGIGGDIHFDNDEDWADIPNHVGNKEGTDFFSVALHELGHSLGLSHSSIESSIMFPYYTAYDPDKPIALDYDDIMGMYHLYISKTVPDDKYNQNSPTEAYYPTTGTESTTRSDHPTYWPTTTNRVTVSYDGDVETVDVHKEHEWQHLTPRTKPSSIGHICNGHFDAVATLRGELFIFKDKYIWRLRERGQILRGYPTKIRDMFPFLPKDVNKIDAAYERGDGNIIFFAGKQFWVSDGTRLLENSPRPLTDYGLPDNLENIDAVQLWGLNHKVYIYKNDRFWRYNETSKTMDQGYPMHMDRWPGVPHNLDAATTWIDGITYFFKDELFWKFDNEWIRASGSSPLPVGPLWLGCKEDPDEIVRLFGSD
ncbi:hypothetical protein GWI33_006061 [Rhynchophorus ferrugineus]|uniref:Peptidase metallopeptidase domain-containing protein n=1 Tax=Rhynchophorus ferrugineus TaxID=354439 RepID=A0A834MJL5_RHYFE|nr:hypothetical protein GWI33_006061 [Rhynchophorus ferrugineus]